MITHFERHRDFYRLLNDRGLIHLLKDAIMDICGPKPEYEKNAGLCLCFCCLHYTAGLTSGFSEGCKNPQRKWRICLSRRDFNRLKTSFSAISCFLYSKNFRCVRKKMKRTKQTQMRLNGNCLLGKFIRTDKEEARVTQNGILVSNPWIACSNQSIAMSVK